MYLSDQKLHSLADQLRIFQSLIILSHSIKFVTFSYCSVKRKANAIKGFISFY